MVIWLTTIKKSYVGNGENLTLNDEVLKFLSYLDLRMEKRKLVAQSKKTSLKNAKG